MHLAGSRDIVNNTPPHTAHTKSQMDRIWNAFVIVNEIHNVTIDFFLCDPFRITSSLSHWATVGAPETHLNTFLIEMPRIDSNWPSLYSFNNYFDSRHTQTHHFQWQFLQRNTDFTQKSAAETFLIPHSHRKTFSVSKSSFFPSTISQSPSNETEYHKFFPETWMKLQINIQCGRATTSSHELMQWTKYRLFQCPPTTTTIDDEIGTGTVRMQTDIFLSSHTISRQGISTYCPKPPFDYRELSECVSKSH